MKQIEIEAKIKAYASFNEAANGWFINNDQIENLAQDLVKLFAIPDVSGSLPDIEIRDFRTSNDITEDEMIEKEAAKYWQHSSCIQSKWFEKGAKWMRDLLRQ